jgi:glycosyltransferase involved in cell wall biosynthesis
VTFATTRNQQLVSAIIPTYNRGYIVSRAIESVLRQSYPHVEIIVVDDGSTDDTQQVLDGYRGRIRVVTQANAGPSAARNRGIEASTGSVVAFLDSDDIWLPTKLERQMSLLMQTPDAVPCCLSNGVTKFPDGQEWRSFEKGQLYPSCPEGIWLNPAEVLAVRFILFCQLVAIRRTALDQVGYFDEHLRFLEDYDLALRLSLLGPWAFISEPLAEMHVSPTDSLSRSVSDEHVTHAEYILGIRQGLLASAHSQELPEKRLRPLKWAIKKAHRDLATAQLRESPSSTDRVGGDILKFVERLRVAMYRRSPWFPKAITMPVRNGIMT